MKTTLVMKSWMKGLETVSLIKAVNEYSTGSLSTAHAQVTRFLDGERVTLEFASEAISDEFRRKAEALGVHFE
jgi:hypothetical protein